MSEKIPKFKIGDKFKRTDYDDPKTYIIDEIRKCRGYWIYGTESQTWANGWAWISELNMKIV